MEKSGDFIARAKVSDIPWHRLATPYGRATEFPVYFEELLDFDISKSEKAGTQIALNIEHQSTLFPATPFALIFLARVFEKVSSDNTKPANRYTAVNLLDIFIKVAECCSMGDEVEHAAPLPFFEDMLKEEYLWPEEYDEEADAARYEDAEGPFPDALFYGFYAYSEAVLKSYTDTFQKYAACAEGEPARKSRQLLALMR